MSARGYMLRSARGDWRTPPEIVARVEAFGGAIDLDPCAAYSTPLIGRINFTGPGEDIEPRPTIVDNDGTPAEVREEDGLLCEWHGAIFVNPPFGELARWTQRAAAEARNGNEIVFLLPARTDTAYWHRDIATAQLVCFLRGRLRFVGAPGPCPFPTAIAYWGNRPALFHAAFASLGMVVAP